MKTRVVVAVIAAIGAAAAAAFTGLSTYLKDSNGPPLVQSGGNISVGTENKGNIVGNENKGNIVGNENKGNIVGNENKGNISVSKDSGGNIIAGRDIVAGRDITIHAPPPPIKRSLTPHQELHQDYGIAWDHSGFRIAASSPDAKALSLLIEGRFDWPAGFPNDWTRAEFLSQVGTDESLNILLNDRPELARRLMCVSYASTCELKVQSAWQVIAARIGPAKASAICGSDYVQRVKACRAKYTAALNLYLSEKCPGQSSLDGCRSALFAKGSRYYPEVIHINNVMSTHPSFEKFFAAYP